MDKICPLCNGLGVVEMLCDNCNSSMSDIGPMENFFDDYSADLGKEITDELTNSNRENCVHIFKCMQCHYITRFLVEKEGF